MAASPKVYDVLILGSGPAGLSAALTLSRVHRTVAIFSQPNNAGFRNDGIEEMHNVLSRDGTHPDEFRKISREQIKRYQTADFYDADISRISKQKVGHDAEIDGFSVEDAGGQSWVGRKVVLATGVKDVYPDIEGFAENWPQNIYQCLFCDGHERSHLPAGLLGFPSFGLHFAQLASLLVTPTSGAPTIFTNGPLPSTSEMDQAIAKAAAIGCKVVNGKIARLTPAKAPKEGVTVVLENGDTHDMGFLANKPDTTLNGKKMIEELGVEIVQNPMAGDIIKVGQWGETNVPGVFAGGDATTMMRAVVAAMNSGGLAGVGIVQQLLPK